MFVMPSPLVPESSAAANAGAAGIAGAVVSIVRLKVLLNALGLPAASVACTRREYEPSASELETRIEYEPSAAANAVPSRVPETVASCTVAPATVVPVRWGCLLLVMPSPLVPESSAASSAGAGGVAGGAVSMVKLKPALTPLELPAASVACTVRR